MIISKGKKKRRDDNQGKPEHFENVKNQKNSEM